MDVDWFNISFSWISFTNNCSMDGVINHNKISCDAFKSRGEMVKLSIC